ncbi:MAG: glutamylcysteine synthetase, partial [Candidatus Ornithomonoglobus sp.]
MEQSVIDKAIYEKYITPTKSKTKRFIGIEIEMPVVNLNKAPVEEEVIFKMAAAFRERFGFHAVGQDACGNINSMQNDVTGDDLSFDCCYSNLELSLGKGGNLYQIKDRFDKYYTFINDFFADYNYTLTGMGI